MTTKEILIAARKLIESPEHWIQGTYRIGDAFCAYGALAHAASASEDYVFGSEEAKLLDAAATKLIYIPKDKRAASYLNDKGPHSLILRAFDLAIEACDQ